jgi:hypothetical protein
VFIILTIRSIQAKVLVTSDDKERLHLYSADITCSFLDKLNHPEVPPSGTTPLSIQITTIDYQPYGSLRDRIIALLLPCQPARLGEEHAVVGDGATCQDVTCERTELMT